MSSTIDFSLLSRHASNVRQLRAGETLFSTGEEAHEFYVVKSGVVNILVDDETVEMVTAGGILGEMALVDSSLRSADAVCNTDAEVVPIEEKQFLRLIENTPFFALEVMQVLAGRLRRMNEVSAGK